MKPAGTNVLTSVFVAFAIGAPVCASSGLEKAIDTALPRVVKLYGLGAGTLAGYGSGVLVSADGLVVTNLSLLVDADPIKVVTPDGARCEAQLLARDFERQLALLQLTPGKESSIRTNERLPYFDLPTGRPMGAMAAPPIREDNPRLTLTCTGQTDSKSSGMRSELAPGDWVVAVGNAFEVAQGSEPVSITHGVFSKRTKLNARRRVKDFPYRSDVLVIDAITSNPGASGGAVVNLDGVLVGMTGRAVISNQTHTHFNYAVPRSVVCDFVAEALAARPSVEPDGEIVAAVDLGRPSLSSRDETSSGAKESDYGIRVIRTGYEKVLPFVERVQRSSPASAAGLREDDLILSVNGTEVADVARFHDALLSLSPGTPLDLVVRRGRRILTIKVIPKEAQP